MVKFSEIEMFIGEANYEIDVFVGSIERTLKGFEERFGLDLNPDFQRGYVWTEEQQTAYMEFFLKGGTSAKTIYFNCPSITDDEVEGDLDSTMLIVDGLQRLTTIVKFLNNELKVFGCYYDEFEDKNRFEMKYGLKFNINKLPNKKDVLKWYVQFNSGGTVHSAEEIERVKKMIQELGE